MDENTSTPRGADVQIVDDNPENLDILASMLRKKGYGARMAINGELALKSIRSHPPDLILLDILMPDMSGIEVCKRLKSDESTRGIPVIFVSALYETNTKLTAFSIGGVDYITKPFQEEEVLARVETHLTLRSMQKRAEAQNAALQRGIMERRRAEKALRESEEQLRAILDSLTDHIRWLDQEMNVQWANQASLAAHPDIVGRNCYKVVVDRPAPCENCPAGKCLETGLVETGFVLHPGVAGVTRDVWWEIIAVPFTNEGDEVVGAIEIARDVTERMRSEEALRNSERRFRDLAEMLPETVFETDLNFKLTFVNQRAEELFGYSEEDLIRGLNGIELIAPGDRDRAKANMAARLKGEYAGTVEYEAVKKDGATFPALFRANAVTREGRLTGLRGIIVDITERKRAEEEKIRLEEQYHQARKMESIGRLAGGVSHDLNNLLSPILCYGEMLLNDLGPDSGPGESASEILKAGLRARNLVRQLLAFSRKQALEYRPVDLNGALANFEKLLRRAIREDIEIRIIPSPHIQPIMADVGQIEQVVMNLAVNSMDAMPEGGRLTIRTEFAERVEGDASGAPDEQTGGRVMLTISDTGSGMDQKTRERLFEPFFSTKGRMGTGLGLATVYGIVKQHGGAIRIDSEPGRGATFRIYFPPSENARIEEKTVKMEAENLDGSETILLVEDNEQVRRLGVNILKRRGYTVLEARHGPGALEVLASHDAPVHLLLTDVIMPGMNGKELYVKAAKKRPGLKALYMSGYTDNVITHRGVLEEGVELIRKPFTIHALAAKVREVLEKASDL
ncbi:MAG: response regulator [Desulfobacterales bacterium]|nr:response regulator [Desulfobacterales bacterium]